MSRSFYQGFQVNYHTSRRRKNNDKWNCRYLFWQVSRLQGGSYHRHLKDNTVLGLTIDKDKTKQHFASSSAKEVFGILVDSRYLNKPLSEKDTTLEQVQNDRSIQV